MSVFAERVKRLKEEKRAVILAHNYQVAEIQEVADYVGDSLGLSYAASQTDAEVIVFCGVHFMAETAKVLNPTKRVILPDLRAGCSLADSCPAHELQRYLELNPGLYVVAYINCTAAVKALSDVIVTSGNAVKIVEKVPRDREILFVPDQNLGEWVKEKTGRPMRLWEGSCYIHVEFTHESISRIRRQYPGAPVVAHPECTRPVRLLADEVCSTEKMIEFCRESPAETIIIVTESGLLSRLQREIPGKRFIAGPTDTCSCSNCRYMKMITPAGLLEALERLKPAIELEQEVMEKARVPIERMLEWSR